MAQKSLPKNWRKVKLGDVGNINMGQSPSSKFYNTKGVGLPFFQGVKDFGEKYPQKSIYCSQPIKIANEGEILLSVRAPVGDINIATEKSCIGRGIAALSMKNKNNKFLYFLMKYYERNLKAIAGGTTYEAITKDQLENFEIEIPDNPKEQQKIAGILSAFDDKIELNNKINQNLEQMVQAIFKERFIDFRFPGYKKVKFVDSELGKIPQGWEIKKAEELLNFEKGIEPGFLSYSTKKKESFVPFYRVRDLDKQSGVDAYIKKDLANGKLCRENDILLSLDAVIGRVKIGCKGSFSSGIRRVYSKDGFIRNSFIYFWLKSPYVQNTISEYASGTSILHAGQSTKYLKFLFNKPLIEKFQEKADPIFNKILENINENQTLASLHDLLLPKLMSGEVRV